MARTTGPDGARGHMQHIRLTEVEHRYVEAAASQAGVSESEYLRILLWQQMDSDDDDANTLLRHAAIIAAGEGVPVAQVLGEMRDVLAKAAREPHPLDAYERRAARQWRRRQN